VTLCTAWVLLPVSVLIGAVTATFCTWKLQPGTGWTLASAMGWSLGNTT
jgi:hypothetical protein